MNRPTRASDPHMDAAVISQIGLKRRYAASEGATDATRSSRVSARKPSIIRKLNERLSTRPRVRDEFRFHRMSLELRYHADARISRDLWFLHTKRRLPRTASKNFLIVWSDKRDRPYTIRVLIEQLKRDVVIPHVVQGVVRHHTFMSHDRLADRTVHSIRGCLHDAPWNIVIAGD